LGSSLPSEIVLAIIRFCFKKERRGLRPRPLYWLN
jgi:hypothetical protein